MNTYKTIKETANSNTIVKELNAAVLTATFKGKGVQFAELFDCSPNSCNVLIAVGSCSPVHSKLIDVVKINL